MSAHKGFINQAVVTQAWVCFEISLSLSKMLSIPQGLLNLFFSLSDREISKQNRACVTTAWLVKPLCALIILLSVQKNLQAESRPRSPLIKPLRALIILLTAHRNLQAESRPRSPLIKPLRALIILLSDIEISKQNRYYR